MAVRNSNVKNLPQKTCKEISDLLSNYLDNSLAARVKRQFDEHLKICPACVAFLNTFQKTLSVVHSVRVEDMPENVRRNVLGFLRSRARRRRTRA
jgi:predicted anti-sigma-YlaC factor YlaD